MIGQDDELREVYYLTHTVRPRGGKSQETIKAWSWDKDLAKQYMRFHGSPNLDFKSYTGTIGEIAQLLEEFVRCEIKIASLKTRDPDDPNRYKRVYVPVTEEELDVVRSHTSCACSDLVHKFEQLQDLLYRVKDKFQDALRLMLLEEMIKKATMRPSVLAERINYDEVRLLVRDNPDDFSD